MLKSMKNRRKFIGWSAGLLICSSFAVTSLSSESSSEENAEKSAENAAFEAQGTAILKSTLRECYSSKLPMSTKPIKVNGNLLDANQAKNVQFFAHCVFPFLPAATRDEQAEYAARTTWWALREGNLNLPPERVFRYSNCNERVRVKGKWVKKDIHRSDRPLYDCPTNMWQVGIAGGQVANYSKEEYVEATDAIFSQISPSIRETDILAWTATLAGFQRGSAEYNGIVGSEGRVKRSWLQRNPLIGTMLVQDLEVRRECFLSKRKWCFNGNYPAAKKFSGSYARMKRSIADLKRIYLLGLTD